MSWDDGFTPRWGETLMGGRQPSLNERAEAEYYWSSAEGQAELRRRAAEELREKLKDDLEFLEAQGLLQIMQEEGIALAIDTYGTRWFHKGEIKTRVKDIRVYEWLEDQILQLMEE